MGVCLGRGARPLGGLSCLSGRWYPGRVPRQPSGLWAFGFGPLRPQTTSWALWAAARAATFPSRAGRDRADGDVEPSPRRVLPPSHGTESRIWLPPLSPCREGGGLFTRLPLRGRRGVRVLGRSSCGDRFCAPG
jgi:hypothetical protein